jgi:hypothetical protein
MTGSAAKPLRWGILGCGFISGDFVRAMDSGLYPNEVGFFGVLVLSF